MKSSRTLIEYSAENFQPLIWRQKEHVSILKSAIVVFNELKVNTFFTKKMTRRKIINELFMSTK